MRYRGVRLPEQRSEAEARCTLQPGQDQAEEGHGSDLLLSGLLWPAGLFSVLFVS